MIRGALLISSLAAVAADHGCHFLKNEAACLNAVAIDACWWCVSDAVPSTCYEKEDAMKLPEGVFDCKGNNKNVPHKCHFFHEKDACVASSEDELPCYWCRSAAVPSTCYNHEEAMKLPPGVFECDKRHSTDIFLQGIKDLAKVGSIIFNMIIYCGVSY